MKSVDIAVIILNYNTSEDALAAAKSVIDNTEHSFLICLVDNASPKKGEVERLQNHHLPDTVFLPIEKNEGYATGNNKGVRFVLSICEPKYIVIMNPDVLVLHHGTIDRLVDRLSKLPANYCGVQPLVWTPYLGEANMQTNIRTTYSYFECLIENFSLFKKIFPSQYGKTIYKKERPYSKELDFEVPSGAFFVTRASDFKSVGLFDERTFLYSEEIILGARFKQKGYKFRFIPKEIVQHEGGKSIGSNAKRVKWYAVKYGMDSVEIYLKYYLNCGKTKVVIVKFFMILNQLIKALLYKLGAK